MLDARPGAPGPAPAQHAQARQQFVEVERLDQIVVGAAVQAADPVGDLVAGGEDHHRRIVLPCAQAAQHFHAVAPRQAQIEQHRVEVRALQSLQGQPAVAHPIDRIGLAPEVAAQAFAEHGVVFHEQQVHAGIVTDPARCGVAARPLQ